MFRWTWILLVIFFCAHSLGAEDHTCTERTVIVSASDSDGKTIAFSLDSADIRGKLNGKPVQILGVTKPTNVERVVIILDASASMASKWQRALELAVAIVGNSPSSSEFALALFAGDEFRTIGFRTGPEIVREIMSFKDVKPEGRTRLRDAIWKSANMFQPSHEGDAIVVVSDGGDNQSKVSRRQLREAMWSRGIRVMIALFVDHYFTAIDNGGSSLTTGPASNGIVVGDDAYADAARLAESSGGFFF